MTSRMAEIHFVFIEKKTGSFYEMYRQSLGEFQHVLVVADVDKNKIRNVVRKTHIER